MKKWNVVTLAAIVTTTVAVILAGFIATSSIAGESVSGGFNQGTTLNVPF